MTARMTLSPEERKARAEALHETITAQVEQLRDSEQWTQFLRYARSFHRYSLSNLCLIWAQFEALKEAGLTGDATSSSQVAGFRKWQELGRQVRRGTKAIRIFGYAQKRIDTPDDDDSDSKARMVTWFPVLSVFDISQTDPIPGHPEIPQNPVKQLTGDVDLGIVEDLTDYMKEQGWTVGRERMQEGMNGYASGPRKHIALSDSISPAQSAKTMIHEVCHYVLGHTDEECDYVAHRGTCEVEAESAAYVALGILGLDSADYSAGYITGWAERADADVMRETAKRVLNAAQRISEILSPAPAAAHELAA
ncbi:ArdC family protein [Microbacterium rhizomatis]|uniref:N-terminal domain-containing protein n=1 Tax=Microbacterium rhizomatis TaxID=1631477 RepID=A0A5J5IY77_9MICO|nr:ArdC family protein [Microbacterium rhizomatis]KAA9105936.1 hypothetical protein F6B43_16365 [Microbacterium rhizomatis]